MKGVLEQTLTTMEEATAILKAGAALRHTGEPRGWRA